TAEYASCADCHRDTHDDWARSSHARSMTHLNLARVNARTKVVERFIPDQHEGLVCTSCHLPSKSDAAPLPPGTEKLSVPHRFQPGAAAASCATCHHETHAEWDAWRRDPRPSVSRWLPGEVAWDESPDERTCVSCHMQPRTTAGGGLVHAFASRRDPAFMRGGLSAHVEPPTAGRGPQLVLTNLAGHRYPSGTIRRALRVELRYDTDAEGAKRLLTRLTDSTVPTTQPIQPALKPAEQRRLELPLIDGASRVTCEITYERNQFEPGSYELPLHTLSERITR
ncbi:MAG: cytochrome c family protein, partial [Planctomycetota bacterium]|nr:cytochrome c family protein [Planctomycetota bacterium]